jgi:lysophospholipase L1-like esterase
MNPFRCLTKFPVPIIAIAACLSLPAAGTISPQDSANLDAGRDSASKAGFLTDTNRTLPMLFIVGDSTVHNLQTTERGWGDVIGKYFDTNKIRVENHALGGRSSRTFQTQGWWDLVLAAARPGDFVLIQLGHNDGGSLDDTNRARGTIRGIGEETRETYNPIMKKPEVVHTYGWYLRKYITDARARGMTPILCSPVPRCPKEEVKAGDVEKSDYVSLSGEVATNENVRFIHLNRIVMGHYAGLTPEVVKSKYFTPADNTHTSLAGAELNAASVIEGLRGLKDCPLKACLLDPSGLAAPAAGTVPAGTL